jgi:hypothetical protein
MTASVAYAHASDPSLKLRAVLAEQSFEYTAFTLDLLARFAKRATARIAQALKRWSAAHRQAVQDRIFWELALTDRRVMDEIRVMRAAAE